MAMRVHKAFPTKIRLPNCLEFVGLHFDKQGYKIQVSEFAVNKRSIFELNFAVAPLAQRSMDEGKYFLTSWKLDESDGAVGAIVIVEESDFIEWFHIQTSGIYIDDQIYHVAVLTQNEWVEVLCNKLPELRMLN